MISPISVTILALLFAIMTGDVSRSDTPAKSNINDSPASMYSFQKTGDRLCSDKLAGMMVQSIFQNNILKLSEILHDRKLAIFRLNEFGYSPVHLAAIRPTESIEMIELLCSNGYDINAVDYLGMTPLHHSVIRDKLREVEAMLSIGAMHQFYNWRSLDTVMHIAIRNESVEMVRLLIAHGVDMENDGDVRRLDDRYQSPLDLAISLNNREVLHVVALQLGKTASGQRELGHALRDDDVSTTVKDILKQYQE
ncbi:ankyrin repeat domain-containing protein [Mucisphaera calidilacus]|uniref:Ankyrin repeats (3 copies) n=1 Tax=Mucisphaera calidilacus TaxID=2527982 RepID=A0A518BVM3_9BACT|nr:ankyrin repeat domain-containing protein [Mucisphaera calidilacus]QDU71011.1 Ankyrin repeats (3 copies) [Mucisphaera calidilacus]